MRSEGRARRLLRSPRLVLLMLVLLMLGECGREPGPGSLKPLLADGGQRFTSFPELK